MTRPVADCCELLLIRHGRTAWNLTGRIQGHVDVPLDEVGRAMAEALAKGLAGQTIDAIYCSDLRRARETAQPLAEAMKLEIQTDWRLREARNRPAESNPPYPLLPFMVETETREQFGQRAREVVQEIATRHAGQRVAVITHGGVIRKTIEPILEAMPQPHPHGQLVRANTAIHYLRWQSGAWAIDQLNDTAHLEAAGVAVSTTDVG